ncbi:MAG TPA: hypothetical protein VNA67_01670 [Pseudonocardiaceae bacterium]|nr:hypothetical protein [Pseudonocardiaceae bacterium]
MTRPFDDVPRGIDRGLLRWISVQGGDHSGLESLEDSLDVAERAITGTVRSPARHSW